MIIDIHNRIFCIPKQTDNHYDVIFYVPFDDEVAVNCELDIKDVKRLYNLNDEEGIYNGNDGVEIRYNKNILTIYKMFVKETIGPINSKVEVWYENGGNKFIECNYRTIQNGEGYMNLPHGLTLIYHTNGFLFKSIQFYNGYLHGLSQTWSNVKKNYILSELNYNFGAYDGIVEWLGYKVNASDSLMFKFIEDPSIYYREDITYHKNGNVKTITNVHIYLNMYETIHGLFQEYYENGQLRYQVYYRHGKKNGLEQMWYDNGRPLLEVLYTNGIVDGDYIKWYNYEDNVVWKYMPYKGGYLIKEGYEQVLNKYNKWKKKNIKNCCVLN